MIRNRTAAERRFNDAPTEVDLVKSVKEVREIYGNLTDLEFISMYAKKYRMAPHDVAALLERVRTQENADPQ